MPSLDFASVDIMRVLLNAEPFLDLDCIIYLTCLASIGNVGPRSFMCHIWLYTVGLQFYFQVITMRSQELFMRNPGAFFLSSSAYSADMFVLCLFLTFRAVVCASSLCSRNNKV